MINPKNFKHVKSQSHQKEVIEEDSSQFPVEILLNEFLISLRCDCCYEKMDLVYDEIHGEIICNKCGCVIVDNFFI